MLCKTVVPAELDKYVGTYTSTQMPLKVHITKNNTFLFVQTTGQTVFPLEAKGGNKFSFAGVTLQFEPAKKTFTLTQGGATYLFTKTD
jgi:D-alanyl-D-alanine carboxypeptidase